MLETIRRIKPTYVVGENVAGLVSMENGKTLDRILSDLEDEGYATEQVIIPACAVGAWHRRDRIWIIGYRNDANSELCRLSNSRAEGISGTCSKRGKSSEYVEKSGEVIPDPRLLGQAKYEQQSAGVVECGEDAADINNQRLQGRSETRDTSGGGEERNKQSERYGKCDGGQDWQPQPIVGGVVNGLPAFMDGYWDREPEGVPRVATGVKDRVNVVS